MNVAIDPIEAEQRLKKVFELSEKVHGGIYASLRSHYPDATEEGLFEKYVWVLAHRRAGKHGEPWEFEREYTKQLLEEWKRRR